MKLGKGTILIRLIDILLNMFAFVYMCTWVHIFGTYEMHYTVISVYSSPNSLLINRRTHELNFNLIMESFWNMKHSHILLLIIFLWLSVCFLFMDCGLIHTNWIIFFQNISWNWNFKYFYSLLFCFQNCRKYSTKKMTVKFNTYWDQKLIVRPINIGMFGNRKVITWIMN